MRKKIQVSAPATVANIGPGYDIFGLALHTVGDCITIERKEEPGIEILPIAGYPDIPLSPKENVAGVAVQALLGELGDTSGFTISIEKRILPGSGLGSSASSSAAAVFGVNELLGSPFTKKQLVAFAMEGERASSGVSHADNVAPALLGGFTFVRSYDPLDIVNVPYPEELYVTVVHPQVEVKTSFSKKILKKEVPLSLAVKQWGNVAGVVTALITKDFELLSRSLKDYIVEPTRALLIPGFDQLKQLALENGALGCSIAGSGPSVFAFSTNKNAAEKLSELFNSFYMDLAIDNKTYVSPINPEGVKIVES